MSSSQSLVSIIIPCYKMGRFIGESLESIGRQSYQNWEVIAVDDCGPEDGTKEAVKDFAGKHPERRIEYYRMPQNRGVSAARNTAIDIARGEYLAFLDPDDWWDSAYLEMQVTEFRNHVNADVVYASALMVTVDGHPLMEWGAPTDYSQKWPENLLRANFINPSGTVAKSECIRRAGGFDTAPPLQHVEDWELWIRLAFAGANFRPSSAPRFYYRQHAAAATSDKEKCRQRIEEVYRKHLGNALMLEVLLDRVHHAERLANELTENYRKLLWDHRRTWDRRIKDALRRLFK